MCAWQVDLLDHLRSHLPGAVVEPYGSVTDPVSLDSWSDLDVAVRIGGPCDVEAALGTPLWAFQSSVGNGPHVVRAVLIDGRMVDLTIYGTEARLPAGAPDTAIRFDAALAAVRFGRGCDLIGLHLTLGITRDALVYAMTAADQETGTTHHRSATPYDRYAARARHVLTEALSPWTAAGALELYGECRSTAEPSYTLNTDGLRALLARGLHRGPEDC